MAEPQLENYASPHLRLGIFYDDHPDGRMTPEVVKATEAGLPESWGGASGYVVAVHLEWEAGGRRHKVTGYKAVPATVTEWYGPQGNRRSKQVEFVADPESLAKLQTNALGRALKSAGYAANTLDLRALMVWRKRKAEVMAIAEGRLAGPDGEQEADAALEAAGKPDEDHDEPDEEATSDSGASSEEPKAELAEERPPSPEATPPEDPKVVALRTELGDKAEALGVAQAAREFLESRYGQPYLKGLDGRQLGTFRAWLESTERRLTKPTGAQDPSKASESPPAPPEAPGGVPGPDGASEGPSGPPGVAEGPPEIAHALEAYMELPVAWREDVDKAMAAAGVTWDRLTADQAQQLLDDLIPACKPF